MHGTNLQSSVIGGPLHRVIDSSLLTPAIKYVPKALATSVNDKY